MIILLPLFIAIGLFIGSALVHLCLMIVGGANQPFETTFGFWLFLKAPPVLCRSYRFVAD
jgi:hypothetical protein